MTNHYWDRVTAPVGPHHALAVIAAIGIPFVRCSCGETPQSAIWITEHYSGTSDDAVAEINRVIESQAVPAGLPLHESADRDADNVPSDRVRAYAEALRNPDAFVDRLTVTDAYPDGPERQAQWERATAAAIVRDELFDIIARVGALHVPCSEHPTCADSDNFCHECGHDWPCSTVDALRGPEPTGDGA